MKKSNKKYKNSVFTLLFSEPDLLRELYCALADVTLPKDVPVSINTLENVFFMGIYNDISFEIGGKLVVLIEHQSTVNPNMTLRLLMYIADVYEKIIKGKNVYSKNRIPIPNPEFFVLYNGTDPFPDEEIMRLSDLFEDPKELGLPEKSFQSLELIVRVININEGRNEAIVNRCKELAEYSILIAKTRSYEKELGSVEKAITEAVRYCQKNGIMSEFLKTHAKEVFSMLYAEFDIDEVLAIRYEDGQTEAKLQIARNMLSEGLTPEIVQRTTELDLETIKELQLES